ncbi:MAG: L-lactate dehydrogenase [Bifidobacteriaceae bacterium]|jgi:L-lactate dehydrogenase|nr:L-lactate dehydrogenase [Bifidobacteriaceae bacterium]
MENTKVTIVGAGAVGSTTAFALAQSGLVRKIVLQDLNFERAEAEALDIMHGSLFYPAVAIKASKDPASAYGSNIVVITAGARQKPGQTRIELAGASIDIVKSLLPPLVKVAPNAVYLIIANPVDIVTYAAQEISGLPDTQVFGSGTLLDTSRLRALLALKTGVNVKNIHAYIAGEHGDSEVPLWSTASIGNTLLSKFVPLPGCESLTNDLREDIHQEVVDAAYKVIAGKGATNYAIALAVLDILTCIMRDERRIMPVSSRVTGIDGIKDVCMSMPFVVGKKGIYEQVYQSLSDDEHRKLKASADMLRANLAKFGY